MVFSLKYFTCEWKCEIWPPHCFTQTADYPPLELFCEFLVQILVSNFRPTHPHCYNNLKKIKFVRHIHLFFLCSVNCEICQTENPQYYAFNTNSEGNSPKKVSHSIGSITPDYVWRMMKISNPHRQAKIVTTINIFFGKKWKKRKVLRIAWFGEKIDQKNILKKKCLEFSDLSRKLIRKTVRQFPPTPQTCVTKNFH